MLDTNMVSYIATGLSVKARRLLQTHGKSHKVCISAITEGEIRYGIAKRNLGQSKKESIERILSSLAILPWDSEAAHAYGELRARLEKLGRRLGAFDEQIAAHALSQQAILVTADKGFSNIARLSNTVNWADDLD